MRCLFMLFVLFFSFSVGALQIYHGDKVTNDQQFPFVVAIFPSLTDEDADCTGSIIAKTWVLTALHCVATYDENYIVTGFADPKSLLIGLGYRAEKKSNARKIIAVNDIFTYSKVGDPLFLHDFALLKLNEPTDVTPVRLPDSSQSLELKNLTPIAVGFGFSDVTWSPDCEKKSLPGKDCAFKVVHDEFLHYGREHIEQTKMILDLNEKYAKYWPDTTLPKYNQETMLGTLSPVGEPTANGDSGGPLIIRVKENDGQLHYVQIGIVSWSLTPFFDYHAFKDPVFGKAPDMYANLTNKNHLSFINKTIKNNSRYR